LSRRAAWDVGIVATTHEALMKDRLVTLIGGGGFLGRYVAQELMRAGARVRIVQRRPRDAWFLKPLGGLGQIQFAAADIRKPEQVRRAVAGAEAVVNLVGILTGDFDGLHVDGAANVAEAAAASGARALVHVSAIGADPDAESNYGRSKGEGEARVRAAFPQATILRPSLVFGAEDRFLNRFARLIELLPVVPVVRPTVKFQPIWAGDVGRAVATAALDPKLAAGKLYELVGPEVISMEQLFAWLAQEIGRRRWFAPIPDEIAGAMARLLGWLPGAPITHDQWLMLQRDNVAMGKPGCEALGITPTPLAAQAPRWLVRFRPKGRFGSATSADPA
jgi:NADH dehydrogenase